MRASHAESMITCSRGQSTSAKEECTVHPYTHAVKCADNVTINQRKKRAPLRGDSGLSGAGVARVPKCRASAS